MPGEPVKSSEWKAIFQHPRYYGARQYYNYDAYIQR